MATYDIVVGVKLALDAHDTPVPTGWSMKSKLASRAHVYLLYYTDRENTFLRLRGPNYRRLLNFAEFPGPPPMETISG